MRHLFLLPLLAAASLLQVSCDATSFSDSNPPIVDFKAGAVRVVDSAIIFTNETLGTTDTEYLWDFGNGTTSTDREAFVVYSSPGSYTVTLKATNGAGSAEFARVIKVLGEIPDTKVLDVPLRTQEGSWWAWAAVTEMVLNYHGVKVQQCGMFKDIYGVECCDDPGACRYSWRLDQIGALLSSRGNMDWETQTARMTMDQIRMEIAQERPVIASIEDNVRNFGSFVVIYGYEDPDVLMIHDPDHGSYSIEYDYSLGNVQEGFQWEYTIFNIEKRPE